MFTAQSMGLTLSQSLKSAVNIGKFRCRCIRTEQSSTGLKKRVVGSIISAIMQENTLELSEWDYEADWEKAVKANADARERREQEAEQRSIQSARINWTSAERKPSKHPRKFLKWHKGI